MKVVMQVNTVWQGKCLRVGDEETVSDNVAKRWVSNRIAVLAEPTANEETEEDLVTTEIKSEAETDTEKDVDEQAQVEAKEEAKYVELADMTVAELKEFAADNSIELKANTKKADIIIAITEVLEKQVI